MPLEFKSSPSDQPDLPAWMAEGSFAQKDGGFIWVCFSGTPTRRFAKWAPDEGQGRLSAVNLTPEQWGEFAEFVNAWKAAQGGE